MVKLGIVSDSHDASFWVEQFLDLANARKYDAVFHLGDVRSDARWLERRLNMPLIAVAGNCDYYSQCAREACADYEGHRILAVHGHRHDVKWGLEQLSYYAEQQGADIVLYGHTHQALSEFVGPVLMVNPGALMHGDYAELIIDGARVVPYLKTLKEAGK